MLPGAVVLSRTGAAVAADFANATGAPIVGDTITGQMYWLSGGQTPFKLFYTNVAGYGAGQGGDDTAYFTQALIDALYVVMPPGSYNISSTLILTQSQRLIGSGSLNTIINITADVVGISLRGSNADLSNFKIKPTVAHTKNGIEVGTTLIEAGRNVLDGLWVEGMGANGIAVIYGSVGTMRNITSLSNAVDGVQFTTDTNNTNAWTLEGFMDLRGNARDGLHLHSGTSQSDPNAPKSNEATIVAQSNGRYGVYVGTRSNILNVYCESNTTAQTYLDTYAYGNFVNPVEGTVTNNSASGSGNIILDPNMNAAFVKGLTSKLYMSGASAAGWRVWNDDGASGYIDFHKTGAGAFEFLVDGFGANQTLTLQHNNASFSLNLAVLGDVRISKGKLYPPTDAGAAQTSTGIYAGTGVPSNANGANGDYYFRTDAGAGTHLYFKAGAAWAAVI